MRRTGSPSASPATWIFVLSPPRDRPRPWAFAPLYRAGTGGMLMSADDGRVDHQPFQIGFACQNGKHVVENPPFYPAVVTSLHRPIVAEPFGQVTPATARASHPQ